mmetsp:Transcript_25035/g.28765  ORF Transcript_25035/g.28765 Transcript_25035/m.28765 type:complete len:142 (+) Transcript_25035:690-1115(+)
MHQLVNELRMILDNYSRMTFTFCSAAIFSKERFEDIIDGLFDKPTDVITDELHLAKNDDVHWELDKENSTYVCRVYGMNAHVKSCMRLLHGFNKLIKIVKVEGKLKADVSDKKLVKKNVALKETKHFAEIVKAEADNAVYL